MTTTTLNLQTDCPVAMAGDWHTDIEWMLKIIRASHEASPFTILFHAGDFGYGLHKDDASEISAMERLSALLVELNIIVYITLGNHENWEKFNGLEPDEDGTIHLWENIYAFPRGYRFTVNGVNFTSLGGAASINYLDLQEGYDWFRDEAITMGDIYRLSDEPTTVFITHDAPVEVKSLHSRLNKLSENWPEAGLRYSEQSQQMISSALAKVEPLLLFHGHYHTDYMEPVEINGNTFLSVGLNMNGKARNIAFLNLDTLGVKWFDQ